MADMCCQTLTRAALTLLPLTYIGFQTIQRTGVNLSLGNTTFNFVMTDQTTALKEVTVKGTAGPLKTGAGTRISQAQIRTLPSAQPHPAGFNPATTPQSSNNSFQGHQLPL